MIKVIIFDLDGLLVDSQPLQYKAYNQVFTDYGYPLSEQDWYQWIHQSLSPKEWIEIHQLPLDLEVIRSEKKEIYDQLIRDELVMKPGAKRAIEQLGSHYRLCVASASQLDSVGQVLDNFNIRWEFEQIVSDKDVERGKPFPDVFLKAAELMGVHPSECIVIEDSVAGLRATKEAGMKSIICPDSFAKVPIEEYKDADRIVQSLEELSLQMLWSTFKRVHECNLYEKRYETRQKKS